VSICLFFGNAPCIGQHIALVESEKCIQPFCPILQENFLAPLCLVFGEIQPHHDKAV